MHLQSSLLCAFVLDWRNSVKSKVFVMPVCAFTKEFVGSEIIT